MSDASTAGLWVVFLWLSLPVVGLIVHLRPNDPDDSATLTMGAFGLFAVSVALWAWTHLTERRRTAPAPERSPDYAGHFGLNDLQLHRARTSQVCVVHHDSEGRIVAVEAVAPTPTAPVAASMMDMESEIAEAA